MKAKRQLALVVVILLAASALRSFRLADLPPGIEHDEVAEWQIARGTLRVAGHHAIFFREAYGQEPAYLYLQAVSISLLGDNVFAVRFTSFAVALLTMAACYRLMRRAFGSTAALTSLAFITVTLWPLFFARVAIRGMTLPLVMCLGTDKLLTGLQSPTADHRPRTATGSFAMAGLWFGLTTYTYLAARAIPILMCGFVVYLALFARKQMRGKWTGLALMLAIAALIAAPLAVYLWRNPDLQFRVDEVSGPLRQLQQGDASGVLAGVRDTLLMFSVRGDQTVRDNWPYRPVFGDPLSAILFYVGLAVALWRWRKPEYAFMLTWLVALLVPTMVTAAPPNFVRTLGALPPIFALPGIGVTTVTDFVDRNPRKSAGAGDTKIAKAFYAVVLGALAVGLVLTIQDYFVRWPAHDETQFVWQTDLASIAHSLDSARVAPDVAVAGLSNETMDDDSLRLLIKRHDLAVRWFDSRTTLIIPSAGGQLFIPRIVPIEPLLRARLAQWGAIEHSDPSGRFTWFDLTAAHLSGMETDASVPLPQQLDDGMSLLGFELPATQVKAGNDLTVLTYWQATTPLPPLKAFVHLTDASGNLMAQSDGLNAPSRFWQSGDIIIQLHRFSVPTDTAPGKYHLDVGLYNSQTNIRAQFQAGGDYVRLPDVEVKP